MENKWDLLWDGAEVFLFGKTDFAVAAIQILWAKNIFSLTIVDNNASRYSESLCGIPILNPDEAFQNRQQATVFICTSTAKSTEQIVSQLSKFPMDTVYFTAEEIAKEYMVHFRDETGIQNFSLELYPPDCNVIERYSCSAAIHLNVLEEDIWMLSSHVTGILFLEIRVDSRSITGAFAAFVDRLSRIKNIQFLIIKTDLGCVPNPEILQKLKKHVLYIQFCGVSASEEACWEDCRFLPLRKLGLPYEIVSQTLYQVQKVGTCPEPFTGNLLREIVCRRIGVANTFRENLNKEICFVYLVGSGIGNQILDYLAANIISESTDLEVILDDSSSGLRGLDRDSEQFEKLELYEVFGGRLKLMSDLFTAEEWSAFLTCLRSLPGSLQTLTFFADENCKVSFVGSHVMMNEGIRAADQFTANPSSYLFHYRHPWKNVPYLYTASVRNPYYYQQFAGDPKCWDTQNRQWAQSILKFPAITEAGNRKIEREMLQSQSVAIHIRRGDMAVCGYFGNAYISGHFTQYFKSAIDAVELLDGCQTWKYFIFSDDITWCQAHEQELGIHKVRERVIYVTGNSGKGGFRDMQLMSEGKILVLSPGSTFSSCAFLLSRTVQKYICFEQFQALSDVDDPDEMAARLFRDAN